MRRTAVFILAASSALTLTACAETGSAESEGAADAVRAETSASAGSAATSADPDTPVTSGASPATASATAGAAPDVDGNPPGDTCGASQVVKYVSQVATPAVRTRIAAEVGHNRIRWIGPDTAVTEDYSPQRLNVMLDRANVITSGRCG